VTVTRPSTARAKRGTSPQRPSSKEELSKISHVKRKKISNGSPVKRKNDFLTLRKGIKPLLAERETPYPLKNADYKLLQGVLHEPAHPAPRSSATLVVCVHGFLSTKDRPSMVLLCTALARVGVSAYRVDLAGHGTSEGRFEDCTPLVMLRDLRMVIAHFRTTKRYARILLLGKSYGGRLGIMLAAEKLVDGLVSVAAPVHPAVFESQFTKQQREELASVGFTTVPVRTAYGEVPFTLKDTFFTEHRELDALAAAPLVTCTTLLIHGTADKLVPPAESKDLLVALGSKRKELYLIGGADHTIEKPEHLDALIARVVAFVKGS
jgi:pimeloyl-ACP methyl ester carboxylesterase